MDETDDLASPRKRQRLSPANLDEESTSRPLPETAPERVMGTSEKPYVLPDSGTQNPTQQNQKELDVGITAYVSPDAPAFSGVLKKRYTDFLVNEILPSGEVLHLRNLRPSRSKNHGNEGRESDSHSQLTGQIVSSNTPLSEAAVESDNAKTDAPASPGSEERRNLIAKAKEVNQSTDGISAEDSAHLTQHFSDETVSKLMSLHSRILSSPQAKPRDLGTVKTTVTSNRPVRTQIHQHIRRIFHSRIDSSTDNQGDMIFSAAISTSRRPANQGHYGDGSQRRQGKLGWADRGGEYLHFSIYKENKDTMEVVSFLARQMKMNVKVFQFAGTKDRRGVTVQRASAYRVEAERLAGQNKMLRSSNVGDFEYQKHGLELGDLKGNAFVITLRDCTWEGYADLQVDEKLEQAHKAVSRSLQDLHEKGFFNYYGLQRFGTFATRTDEVGIRLLQGNFKGACEAILAFSPQALAAAQDLESTDLIGSDDKARAEAIHTFNITGTVNEALEKLPRKYSAESSLIRHLGRNKSDYDGALRLVQRNLKLMYVHAYQSLVWNFAVGERWRLYGDRVVEGDLVMVNEHKDKNTAISAPDEVDADGEVVIQPSADDRAHDIDDVFEQARPLTADEAAGGTYSIFDIVLPLPGFDVIYPPNAMTDFYKTFMASERGGGLDPFDMRRKHKDFSLSGSYRKILARIASGYEFSVRSYSSEDEQFVQTDLDRIKKGSTSAGGLFDDEKQAETRAEKESKEKEGDHVAVILKMQLGSSTYATMALRELTRGGIVAYKPDFGGGR